VEVLKQLSKTAQQIANEHPEELEANQGWSVYRAA
jgi:hypothetical protein